jgi:hypothetical protein
MTGFGCLTSSSRQQLPFAIHLRNLAKEGHDLHHNGVGIAVAEFFIVSKLSLVVFDHSHCSAGFLPADYRRKAISFSIAWISSPMRRTSQCPLRAIQLVTSLVFRPIGEAAFHRCVRRALNRDFHIRPGKRALRMLTRKRSL